MIQVNVTDQSNNNTITINVAQSYGLNTTEVDLTSLALIQGIIYAVRVSGMNKGEVYHLKIKSE